MNKHEINKKSFKNWYIFMITGIILIAGIGGFFIFQNFRARNYQAYIQNAEDYVKQKDYDKAIVAYESAIRVNKKQITPYEGLGEVYIITKRYSKARIVLWEGYEETGSARLNQMYVKIDGLVDYADLDDTATGIESRGSNGSWNDVLIEQLSGETHREYFAEYGNGKSSVTGEVYKVTYQKLGATLYYKNEGNKHVFDQIDAKPYEGAVPSYIVFDDLTSVFYDIDKGLSYEEICEVIHMDPDLQKVSSDKYQMIFEYKNCRFYIDCDSEGYIKNQYAGNKVVPLLEGTEQPVGTVEGYIVDSTTGNPLPDVRVELLDDNTSQCAASVLADHNGGFEIQAEKGSYILQLSMDGYVTEQQDISVNTNLTEDVGVKAMSPELEGGEWRIVLEWGKTPEDLDAHLLTDSYHVCFYSPAARIKDREKANLDVDDRDGYGPETITINSLEKAEHYKFCVHDFTNMDSRKSRALSYSEATVKVYLPSGEVMQYTVPKGKGTCWEVFEITKGKIHEIGKIHSDIDEIR